MGECQGAICVGGTPWSERMQRSRAENTVEIWWKCECWSYQFKSKVSTRINQKKCITVKNSIRTPLVFFSTPLREGGLLEVFTGVSTEEGGSIWGWLLMADGGLIEVIKSIKLWKNTPYILYLISFENKKINKFLQPPWAHPPRVQLPSVRVCCYSNFRTYAAHSERA